MKQLSRQPISVNLISVSLSSVPSISAPSLEVSPVFVVDETPSPMNALARIARNCLNYLACLFKKANGEAEAPCAQLNAKGHVDACITVDSDAFLFGAKFVIKPQA
ncbi:hypothetical protein POTOM_010425 [Populus tomentosa]|uniref:XPG-I domain-containing protein n=1 Tax=Populus tomentosa TaxID=118781 RepID=A0A8X8AAC9_POPTO|nr:hypothetical protein POTOM_010425 [Populus tomentosa]